MRGGSPALFSEALIGRAAAFVRRCSEQEIMLATAESCTGGLVAALLTEIPGSSAVLDRGFVTYSNAAKHDLLGVDKGLIAEHGAVSSQTARAMATGAVERSRATIAVSVTGIAGPGGDTPTKPVGLVHFGLARRGRPASAIEKRFGDLGRGQVRMKSVEQALELLEAALRDA